MKWGTFLLMLLAYVLGCSNVHAEPLAARQYRSDVIREARAAWGLTAPVATMAAQIEQESGWRPDVCSAVACGLGQFTASTAAWFEDLQPSPFGGPDRLNPLWSIRALARYDLLLYQQVPGAKDDCERWAFVLASYNGGLGFLRRDLALCGAGCDRTKWFGNIEMRSNRSAAAFRENRGYPRAILLRRQASYVTWGRSVSCSV